jgi:hypothetical protein
MIIIITDMSYLKCDDDILGERYVINANQPL